MGFKFGMFDYPSSYYPRLYFLSLHINMAASFFSDILTLKLPLSNFFLPIFCFSFFIWYLRISLKSQSLAWARVGSFPFLQNSCRMSCSSTITCSYSFFLTAYKKGKVLGGHVLHSSTNLTCVSSSLLINLYFVLLNNIYLISALS